MRIVIKHKKAAYILAIILAILYTACTHKASLSSGKKSAEPFTLALITLKISKTNHDYSVLITDSKILEASPGKVDPEPVYWKENDFYGLVLDKNKRVRDSLQIDQPLSPRFEFPQENGKIGSTVIELNENEVLLRFSFQKDYKWIRIGVIEKGNRFRTLNTIELPFKN
jgi:hypothetical protein